MWFNLRVLGRLRQVFDAGAGEHGTDSSGKPARTTKRHAALIKKSACAILKARVAQRKQELKARTSFLACYPVVDTHSEARFFSAAHDVLCRQSYRCAHGQRVPFFMYPVSEGADALSVGCEPSGILLNYC